MRTGSIAMRTVCLAYCACLVVPLLFPGPASAVTVVADGADHVYAAPFSTAQSYYFRNVGCPDPGNGASGECTSPGAATTASLETGAAFGGFSAYDTSSITVNGGEIGHLSSNGSSVVTMNGGRVWDNAAGGSFAAHALAHDQSTLYLTGGEIDASLYAYQESTVIMTGGLVTGIFGAGFDATAYFRGGEVDAYLSARNNGTMYVEGGIASTASTSGSGTMIVSGSNISLFRADDDSVIWIVGEGFEVDGISVGLGTLQAQTGQLTGTLANGQSLDAAFAHSNGGSFGSIFEGTIILVPEPSTGLLVGFGLTLTAMGSRRKSSRPGTG